MYYHQVRISLGIRLRVILIIFDLTIWYLTQIPSIVLIPPGRPPAPGGTSVDSGCKPGNNPLSLSLSLLLQLKNVKEFLVENRTLCYLKKTLGIPDLKDAIHGQVYTINCFGKDLIKFTLTINLLIIFVWHLKLENNRFWGLESINSDGESLYRLCNNFVLQ